MSTLISASEAARLKMEALCSPRDTTVLPPDASQKVQEAEALLRAAEKTLEDARREAENIREEARKQGHVQGYQECMSLLTIAHQEYDALLARSGDDLARLAMEMTRNILGRRLETTPEILVELAGKALQLARGRKRIVLRVHPDDFGLVEAHKNALMQIAEAPMTLLEDAAVPRGACIIDTEQGSIETDLDIQLEALAQALNLSFWGEDA